MVTVSDADEKDIEKFFKDTDETVYSSLTSKNIEVHRSPGIILINNLKDEELAREVIESQIFFREFKSQLHRYLAIHRILWEKIRAIKEKGNVKGTDIDKLRNELSVYQKTINLIGARINQMPSYVKTRQKINDTKKDRQLLTAAFSIQI